MTEYQNEVWLLIRLNNLEDLVKQLCSCRVLIGFHKNDHKFEEELRKYLIPAKTRYKLDIQSEGTLLPGAVVEEEIKELMRKCHILLILVSADFHLDPTFDRYWIKRKKEASTVPIKIKNCTPDPEIAALKSIPKGPIQHLRNAKAFEEVVTELEKVFQNHYKP